MVAWPESLPITRDNYREKPPSRGIRSNMDIGPDKLRKRSTVAVRGITLRLMLTDAQLDIFDEFYDENETLVFDFVDPRTGNTKRTRFVEVSDYDLQETMWVVALKLEYLP